MHRLLGIVLPVSAVISGVARADCAKPYSSEALGQDLAEMSSALRAKDDASLKSAGKRLDAGLGCIDAALPAPVFAAAFRSAGLYHFRFGSRDRATEWFRSGLELDSSFEWDIAEVEPGAPLRQVFDSLRGDAESGPIALDGQELAVPDGAELVLDGRPLRDAAATQGRPHVLQVVSGGAVSETILIEGNAIPDRFLAAAVVADASEEKKSRRDRNAGYTPTDDLSVVKVKRVRPAAKTPLMVSGAVLALGAGGIYGASYVTRSSFDSATTSADLSRYRSLTNTLVIASAATLTVGLSVEYAGIMLGANPGGARVGWQTRF